MVISFRKHREYVVLKEREARVALELRFEYAGHQEGDTNESHPHFALLLTQPTWLFVRAHLKPQIPRITLRFNYTSLYASNTAQ